MTRFLLDTSIVSALGAGKPTVRRPIADLCVRQADRLSISAVMVMEIESGTRQYARKGSPVRVADLSHWLATLMLEFRDRVLPFNDQAAIRAGRLEALALGRGHHPGLADVIIAAIADLHGLTILTRNLRHFRPLEIPSVDPFVELPEVAR